MAKAVDTSTDTSVLNLYQKLARISGDIGAIKKTGRNNEQKFDFIEYAAIAGELRTLFATYGVVIIPYMQRAHRQHRVEVTSKYGGKGEHVLIDFTFVVVNADSPTEKFSVTWTGEATDFGDKGTNKAATSALKYYLMRQFNISEKGEDPDAESPERVQEAPTAAPEPPRRKTALDAMQEAGELLKAKGVTDKAARLSIIFGIAQVGAVNELTGSKIKHVLETIKSSDVAELLELYAAVEDTTTTDVPPVTTEDLAELANEAVAQRQAEIEPEWVIPDYQPTKMVQVPQLRLIEKWLAYLATVEPETADGFVWRTIGKDRPGTYIDAMKVIQNLADVLNGLNTPEVAA